MTALHPDQFGDCQFRPIYESEHGSAHVTPVGYVHNLSVDSEFRSRGEGSAIMRQITHDADVLGRSLKLHARDELHPWYESMGFQRKPTGAHKGESLLVRKARKPGSR